MTPALTRPRVAIVGAGLAGLACARELKARGAWVTVFEQGLAPGGRAVTVQSDAGAFDAGAQYFTVHHHRFEAVAQRWIDAGLARRWRARIVAFSGGGLIDKESATERYVGVPGMGALARALAASVEVRYGTTVERIDRRGGLWLLFDEQGRELSVSGFDVVCLALPSTRAAQLAAGLSPLAQQAAGIDWEPCWAVLLALARPTGLYFDGAFVNDDPILSWIARDSGKPDRAPVAGVAERWVLHARPRWSRRYFEMPQAQAAQWLVRAFSARIGRALLPLAVSAVRWPQATPVNPLPAAFLWDDEARLGMAGDWCNGPRVEGAYLSGLALAQAIAA
ncbi:MAG: FAD-dependent oxidoreductase [Burkholderiaceae bacterium]|nr:FAD-dependent oxidoreductase [Burkholderiaceae bacterium]